MWAGGGRSGPGKRPLLVECEDMAVPSVIIKKYFTADRKLQKVLLPKKEQAFSSQQPGMGAP